jgi:hypothetical protein
MDVPGEPRVHPLQNPKKTQRVGHTRHVPSVPCRRTHATGVGMIMRVMPLEVLMGA